MVVATNSVIWQSCYSTVFSAFTFSTIRKNLYEMLIQNVGNDGLVPFKQNKIRITV